LWGCGGAISDVPSAGDAAPDVAILDAMLSDPTSPPDARADVDIADAPGTPDSSIPDSTPPDAVSSDAPPDAVSDVADAAPDADVPCMSELADERYGVFVDQAAPPSDASTCGSHAAPCQTIKAGIDAASTANKQWVYIAPGVYTGGVRMNAVVSLKGGWTIFQNGVWGRTCQIGTPPANTAKRA